MDFLALSPLLPEITLAIMSMALLLMGAFGGDGTTRAVINLAVVTLLLVIVMIGGMLWGGAMDINLVALGKFTDVSAFTSTFKLLILGSAAVCLLMSYGYLKREEMHRPEYAILVLLSVTGMLLMLSAHNLLMLYMGLELQSLALYVLAAFRRDATRSTEAGLKYFVLGALASGLLLYGISLVYGFVGSLDFATIANTLTTAADNTGVLTGFAFILVALAFKVSAAPFHMWVPDVYEGAPTPVTAFFSVVPKLAAMGILIKVLYGPFISLQPQWIGIVAALSALSMLVGAFGAIGQDNLKRLLAYSSIGHVGFALMALAAGDPASVMVYLIFYIIMSLAAFGILLLMRRDERMLESMEDISGLSRVHPALAAAMAVVMFSMAGIPPLVGFFTKLYVLMAAVKAGMIWLAILGAVASVVGAYYYLRVVKVMYFDEPVAAYDRMSDGALNSTVLVAAALTLGGLILISPAALLAQMAVKTILP
jgi:NADH-quinone oxidoreductase subunit N